MRLLTCLLLCLGPAASLCAFELQGEPVQGGLIFGLTTPGAVVELDGTPVLVSQDGRFVLGFDRDEQGEQELVVTEPDRPPKRTTLLIHDRDWKIERVDGLPQRTVTPDPEASERIRQEAQMVATARLRREQRADYAAGFSWPAQGRISGVYGSQRVLNGTPARPHYGVDIAAPTGTPVYAPAAGTVTLTHPDMFYSGGTIILDHGQGLSSTFLHLSAVLVESGKRVNQGDLIGKVGMTGRASGPHLDWRMNWLDRRVDPQNLVKTENGRTSP